MNTVAVRTEEIDFDAAAREHRPFLLQIAVASTRNPTDAEDVVQEALLRGYRGIQRFRGDFRCGSGCHASSCALRSTIIAAWRGG